MHRNADGLIGFAQPAGRQAIAFGAEQKRGPLADAPVLGVVDGIPVRTPFAGLVRGLVADGTPVSEGVKIGDVDPRQDTDWHEISDKALAVAGGVLEAVLTWLNASGGVRPTGAPARTGSRPLAPGR